MLEDHAKIAALIQQTDGIAGRKRLQKVLYILQKLGFPFHETYRFHFYGPYSDELSMQIEELCDFGFVVERKQAFGGRASLYRLSEAGERFLDHYKGILPDIHDFVDKLISERTDFLELVSTLFYFDRLPRSMAAEKARAIRAEISSEDINRAYTYISELYAECSSVRQTSKMGSGASF